MTKKGKTLTSQGYELSLGNSNTSFYFQLNVQGDDGNPYYLKAMPGEKTELIKVILKVIGERWPQYNWKFQIDDDGDITDMEVSSCCSRERCS